MDRKQIIQTLTNKIKLVRTEANYSQDKMAEVLGISKKTLVQIEKGRIGAGWSTVVTLCALFQHSEILQASLGSNPLELLEVIAHDTIISPREKTLGGKVWWKEIKKRGKYRLQQNLISHHYRILDEEDYRYFSSFDKEGAMHYLNQL